MELKNTLNKPCSERDRLDFIVENNHNYGYEIRETEQSYEAWGLTQEEIEEQDKQQLINEKLRQLDELDLKSIRSLRAKEAGTATQEDLDKLDENEAMAAQLRQEIRELQRS